MANMKSQFKMVENLCVSPTWICWISSCSPIWGRWTARWWCCLGSGSAQHYSEERNSMFYWISLATLAAQVPHGIQGEDRDVLVQKVERIWVSFLQNINLIVCTFAIGNINVHLILAFISQNITGAFNFTLNISHPEKWLEVTTRWIYNGVTAN